MWPGQERADSEPNWRLHRGPHDSGRPVTDEPLNRSWQWLVEWGAGAKQWGLNRILSLFKTRHLRTSLNLKMNDSKTNKRLTKGSFTTSPSLEAIIHRLFIETNNDKTVLPQGCLYNVCFNVDRCQFIMLWTVGFVQNCNIVGMDAVNRPLEVVPKHLKRIEVKTLTGTLHNALFSSVEDIVLFVYFSALGCCPVASLNLITNFNLWIKWTEKCPDKLDNNYFFLHCECLIVCVLFIKLFCIFYKQYTQKSKGLHTFSSSCISAKWKPQCGATSKMLVLVFISMVTVLDVVFLCVF